MMKKLKQLFKGVKADQFIRRIDRYIIMKFLGTYFFSIALIISIAVVFDINEHIDKFIDGAAVKKAGKKTYEICKEVLDDIITVPEGAVCTTIIQLYNMV